jgi:hypothetical protein
MPYVAGLEGVDPLADWDLDPDSWQVVTEAGHHELRGTGPADQLAVILGRGERPPEWAYSEAGGLVISSRFNLPAEGGMRLLFRSGERGFYGVQVLPGGLSLRRAPVPSDMFSIDSGRLLAGWSDAPVEAGLWHHLLIWLEGANIYIYLDRRLGIAFRQADLLEPGAILLQAHSASSEAPLRLDDLRVQRPGQASQHFDGREWPGGWERTPAGSADLKSAGANRYMDAGKGELLPLTGDLDDFVMACRFWSREEGFRIYVREGPQGVYVLDFDAGTLAVLQVTPDGEISASATYPDSYDHEGWYHLVLEALGNRLAIYRDGELRHEASWPGAPLTGRVRFALAGGDALWLDDCLFYSIEPSAVDQGRVAAPAE